MMDQELARPRGALERQRFLEAVLESAVDYAIIALDLDGCIIEWTEGARRILGWEAEEMLGRDCSAFFPPDDIAAKIPEAEMRDAREKGRASDERWHMHKDGTRFYALGEMMPLRGEDGRQIGYLKILRDRTPQRLAEDALRDREAFLSSVLGSSGDCIKVLDLDGRLTFMTEAGQKVMEVSDFKSLCGLSWPTLWESADRDAAEAAVAAARAGEVGRFQGFCPTMKGTPKHWDVVVTPVRSADGNVINLLAMSRDITAIRQAEHDRHSAKAETAKLAALVEQSGECVSIIRTDGTIDYLNAAGLFLLGIPDLETARATKLAGYFTPRGQTMIDTFALPAAASNGFWEGELRLQALDGGDSTPVLHTVFPLRGADDSIVAFGSVTRDLTSQKAAEKRQTMINHELSHRMKNMLAMVQSIAFQTLRSAPTVADAREILSARIVALSKAHDILLEDQGAAADAESVVAAAVAPHDEHEQTRFVLNGPRLTIGPRAAMGLSLMLHELATNAAKYGALSTPGGRVAIEWAVESGRFTLVWRESGGPPVAQPKRFGFGSRLIERGLAADVGGKVALTFDPAGVACTVNAALASLQAGA